MSNGTLPLPAAEQNPAASRRDQPGGVLRALFAPLEQLIVSGGDSRLQLDRSTGANGYFCRPAPCPDTLEFSSSTATSISQRGYDAASNARDALMRAAISDGIESAFDDRIEAMRCELRQQLGLTANIDVIFSASGTDGQLQALHCGRAVLGPSFSNVVVGADQTGSGTVFTARGQHFGERTASDHVVTKGALLDGLSAQIDSVAVPLGNGYGGFVGDSELDAKVYDAVERQTFARRNVLLHAMDCSKLGRRAPSDELLLQIAARWPREVLIAIDACQMRLSRRQIAWYLDAGFMVLITGSKYFTGPPFSGALLLPPALTKRILQAGPDLTGLKVYGQQSDWPRHWHGARAQLPAGPNFGQWLRWEAALAEINGYFAVPDPFRQQALHRLGSGIAQLIDASPHLQLLPQQPADATSRNEELALPTIFPFTLKRDGAALPVAACKDIHRKLALPPDRDQAPCLLGQPVEWHQDDGGACGVLRLCLSARHITDAWSSDPAYAEAQLGEQHQQVATTLARVEQQLTHRDDNEPSKESHGPRVQ